MNSCICCDAAAVNPNGIETLLANGFNTCFIKSSPVFINFPKNLPKRNWLTWSYAIWVFDHFKLAHEPFAKFLWHLETCVLANNNLWGKLFSLLESPTTFDQSFKVTSVPFFIPDFNLLNYKLDHFTFRMLYWVILFWYFVKTK